METIKPYTLTVPEAGRRYFGLSKNSSYEAARRGDIPVIRVGRLLRVPIRAMEQIMARTCGMDSAPRNEPSD
ncbi:MAG: helix-turn-helix domain-containing protein [Acidimicrobiia bacterium]|nr:helix-turn-helix domain-containing protein [Acidimicrobiia bacterium]MBM4134989.1 helix-turn-helix domain-containing protein [Nitrospira sp.]